MVTNGRSTKKEEGQKNEQDLLVNSGGIKPGNITKTGDESIEKDLRQTEGRGEKSEYYNDN